MAEREEIRSVLESDEIPKPGIPLVQLLRFRETWGLVTAKFLSDAAWYFYLFWLPRYLYDARGFDIKAVGSVAWIPHAAAGIGCLCGGGLSTWLLARQYPLNRARKLALGASAAMMPLLAFVPHVSVTWAIVLFCIGYFGQQSWSTLVMILPTDLFPKRAVGTVAGLVGLGGAMGGIAFGQLAGYLLDQGAGYAPIFALVSTFHVLAFGLILLTVRTVRPLELQSAAHPTWVTTTYKRENLTGLKFATNGNEGVLPAGLGLSLPLHTLRVGHLQKSLAELHPKASFQATIGYRSLTIFACIRPLQGIGSNGKSRNHPLRLYLADI